MATIQAYKKTRISNLHTTRTEDMALVLLIDRVDVVLIAVLLFDWPSQAIIVQPNEANEIKEEKQVQ